MDDVNVAPDGGIVPLGDAREFRRHPQRILSVVTPVLRRGHRHTALPHAQIQQLVDVRLILQQDVLPRDADVRRAALDVDRHVGGLHPEVAHVRLGIFKNQLPAVLADRRAGKARPLKRVVDRFAQASLGQGDIKHAATPRSPCRPAAPAPRDTPRSRSLWTPSPSSASACRTARRTARCQGYPQQSRETGYRYNN